MEIHKGVDDAAWVHVVGGLKQNLAAEGGRGSAMPGTTE